MPQLNKINEYLFIHGGKQIRPMFTLLIAKALRGFCNDNVIRCAAAVEMLHTATLLHDDVADDASMRRGAPTVKALFSPTASVLVGDFWLSRAIESIVRYCDKEVIYCFSKCLEDLAEGEMIQMEKASTLETTEDDYIAIIYRKTASLFEAAMKSAAISIEASNSELEAVTGYAYHIGLSFQIMDDIFDYCPELGTGKPAGLDILEKKITLPLFGAFNNAPDLEARELKARIRSIGFDKEVDMKVVSDTTDFVHRYNGLEYAKNRLKEEVTAAIDSISEIPSSEAKGYLESLAEYMACRVR
jgi:Geranylgeranyl pyrophosphate synthase